MPKVNLATSLVLFFLTASVQANEECDHILGLAIDAALGEPTAQYNLAVEHWRGECVDKDLSVSRILWEKAATSGMADAYNNYGFLLYYGEGGDTDHVAGIAAWERGTVLGSTESMIHLANANLDERHLQVDSNRARVLASAARKCALLEESTTHVEMADDVLAQTGAKLKKRDKIKVEALVSTCSAANE